MNDDTVIPPVESGQIESSLEFKYDHDRYGDGGFEATSEHAWTFDFSAYHDYTGLDIGADLPWVPQENGHTLRIVTEYTWMHSEYGSETTYSLTVEETAYRGTTSYDEVYWTRGTHYRLNEDMVVVRCSDEKQRYYFRESDEDVKHFGARDLTDTPTAGGEEFVRRLHSGFIGEDVREQLQALIVMDTPDDAVSAEVYMDTQSETPVTGD